MNTITAIPYGLHHWVHNFFQETNLNPKSSSQDFYLAKTFLIFTVKRTESSKSRSLLLFWNLRNWLEFQVLKFY